MYNILIVDDEPLICKGLSNLLSTSGLSISNITIAYNGYEALDYIRMEDVDLLITDIQMGNMNGIELMQQAKMIKPHVQTIIISAHETFQYAQMAIRLGAKDYLIKPLNSDQFLDSVRNVLLKMDKPTPKLDELMSNIDKHFHMKEPVPEKNERISLLLIDSSTALKDHSTLKDIEELSLKGPYFSIIKINLNPESQDNEYIRKSGQWLQYAALNIVKERLEQDWNALSIYSSGNGLSIIFQWGEEDYQESTMNKIDQLDLLGRSLHIHIHKYLKIKCIVGISQILKGIQFLDQLNTQAEKAILWNQEHSDHYVFYYGDFNWNIYSKDPSDEERSIQSNVIVEKTKQYIEQNYAQKGLTINDVAKKNHVSPNYLSYLFKKYLGFNLWEYVIKLRMEESKELLLNTDMRRYEIAEKVGYESPEHFSKIFKKYYGMSPTELKK